MIEILDLVIRIFILYFLTVAGHVGSLRGKKWLSLFIIPMWLLYFRLSLLRMFNMRIGAIGHLSEAEFDYWADVLQSGYVSIVIDIIFLIVIVLLYRELRVKSR